MQGSRSLFQTGIKLQGQPGATGISKSRPFLNIWSSKDSSSSNNSSTKLSDEQRRSQSTMSSATTISDFEPVDKKGAPYPLSQHAGKVLLLVNVASECGFTAQYGGLESLYKSLSTEYPSEFLILGFPCNQFGGQEPGSNDDIQSFCQVNHGVTFPILGKTEVNGNNASPVWEWMKKEKPSLGMKRVKWNFEKFLIGRDGLVKERWASTAKPEGLKSKILEELKKPKPEKPTPTSTAEPPAPAKSEL